MPSSLVVVVDLSSRIYIYIYIPKGNYATFFNTFWREERELNAAKKDSFTVN